MDLFSHWFTAMMLENYLGFMAGIMINIAAVPQIIRNIRVPNEIDKQSLTRNLLMVLGNILWIAHGAAISSEAIILMCGINALLNAIIVGQMTYKITFANTTSLHPPFETVVIKEKRL